MLTVLTIIHLGLCVFLIAVVLLQQGKGADAGAVFGSANNSLFGAAGANTLLTRITTTAAIAFMVTSVLLVRAYTNVGLIPTSAPSPLKGSLLEGDAAPAAPAAPVAETSAPATAPVAAFGAGALSPTEANSQPAPVTEPAAAKADATAKEKAQ